MGATWRVRDKSTFSALARHGRRAVSGPIRVTWLASPIDVPGRPCLAYAVPRGTGGAVTRNLVRRRLRAAAADLAPGLAPGAYLVAYRGSEAAPFGELREHLTAAARSTGALGARR